MLVNRGELIQPAVPLPADLDLRTPGGAPINPHALSGKWTLVFLAGSACTDDCPHRLRDLRQIRLAVGARLLGLLGGGSAALNRVYILDPMGNLMMRYPPNAPAKHTL